MFRYSSCLLIVICALARTQSLQVVARAALPDAEQLSEEEPPAEGRVFSIIRDSDRDHRPYHDSRPIIITQPQQPSYPPHYPQYPQYPQYPPYQQHPQPHPQPYPQPYPFPVPVHPPYHPPPTIIKPIIRPSYHPRPSFGGGYGYGFPPFINITYSPVLAAATATTGGIAGGITVGRARTAAASNQQQLSDLAQFSQQLLAQTMAAQPQLLQYPSQAASDSNNLIYQQDAQEGQQYYGTTAGQLIALNLDEDQQQMVGIQTKPKRNQYTVRRSQKSKKRSKKQKNQPQLVLFAVDSEADTQGGLVEENI